MNLGQLSEKEPEDDHHKERLNNGPGCTQLSEGLIITL